MPGAAQPTHDVHEVLDETGVAAHARVALGVRAEELLGRHLHVFRPEGLHQLRRRLDGHLHRRVGRVTKLTRGAAGAAAVDVPAARLPVRPPARLELDSATDHVAQVRLVRQPACDALPLVEEHLARAVILRHDPVGAAAWNQPHGDGGAAARRMSALTRPRRV